eukprot:TRINITY_DN561_c1_g1_i6.p1 TRINITY_DN561_c1_g1~~TRINITY_DN561_c1_g1_i6.p1  ORF type:complete len:814 (+),score=97.03 TRINITY_DN561_c1_g1_i6:8276-10717(+)
MLSFSLFAKKLSVEFQKTFRSLRFSIRRVWLRSFLSKPIPIPEIELYTALALSKNDIDVLLAELRRVGRSQWYKTDDEVVTITDGLCVNALSAKSNLNSEFIAVLPCQCCQNGFIAVRKEFEDSLEQFNKCLSFSGWFGHSSNSTPSHRDIENPRVDYPVLFLWARLSDLTDYKIRRIGILKLIRESRNAVTIIDENASCCWFVLDEIDYHQSGLFTIAELTESKRTERYDFFRALIDMQKLDEFISRLSGIHGLIFDILVVLNDRFFWPSGDRIYLQNIENTLISKQRAIDYECLSKVIHQAFQVRTNSAPPSLSSASTLSEYESIPPYQVERAIRYAMRLCEEGYAIEYPVKIVHGRSCHLSLERWNKPFESVLAFKANVYRRKVIDVSPLGYRTGKWSIWMWIIIATGFTIPVAYMGVRWSDVPPEDLIATATALVGLYIAVVSPLIWGCCYKGEKLKDVLSNIRNVDTQVEFDARGRFQNSDILEVLRESKKSPQFFGGNNMSYIAKDSQNQVFDAAKPMAFPNLELHGFGLYEDEGGNMYMLDRWSNIFEVSLHCERPGFDPSQENNGPPTPNNYEMDIGTRADLTIRCKKLVVHGSIEKAYDTTEAEVETPLPEPLSFARTNVSQPERGVLHAMRYMLNLWLVAGRSENVEDRGSLHRSIVDEQNASHLDAPQSMPPVAEPAAIVEDTFAAEPIQGADVSDISEVERVPLVQEASGTEEPRLSSDANAAQEITVEKAQIPSIVIDKADIGCLVVAYISENQIKTVKISRILPFGARKRCIRTGWRYSSKANWELVNNADILRLDVKG